MEEVLMFNMTLESKLEKIKKKHNEKLAIMQLDNELKIEENKLKNKLRLQELNAENGQLEIKRNIFNLNNTTKKDTYTIKSGKKLKSFALLTTLVSTCLTIAGGYKDFSHSIYTLITYIVAIVVLQSTVYLIASQETRIKQEFHRHYSKVIALKYCLLGISIYSNYKFFAKEVDSLISNVIIFVLCVALDLIAIYLVSLAYDQKTLTFSYQDDVKKVYNKNNLLYKLAYNMTYKVVYGIESKYTSNKNKLKNLDSKVIEVKQIEKQQQQQLLEDPRVRNYKINKKFKNKNLTKKIENAVKEIKKLHPDLSTKFLKVKNYLLNNLSSGEVVNSGELKTKFKLTITDYRKILEQLKLENIVYTENKKTYMAKQLLKAVK
jgi:hypothetical protein